MSPVLDNLDLFWSGFLQSLRIIGFALVGSLLLGTLIAAFRVSPVAPLRAAGATYVSLFRNCPLTVVLFFCAFGLPVLGLGSSFFWLAVLGLILYTAAFVCEALRAGIGSVSAGQAEAARSLGLTFTQTLRLVVLPQAFRTVVPPLGSVVIAMMKNSAIAGAFGVGGDLFAVGATLSSARGLSEVPVYTGVLVGYLLITLPSAAALQVIERRTAIAR